MAPRTLPSLNPMSEQQMSQQLAQQALGTGSAGLEKAIKDLTDKLNSNEAKTRDTFSKLLAQMSRLEQSTRAFGENPQVKQLGDMAKEVRKLLDKKDAGIWAWKPTEVKQVVDSMSKIALASGKPGTPKDVETELEPARQMIVDVAKDLQKAAATIEESAEEAAKVTSEKIKDVVDHAQDQIVKPAARAKRDLAQPKQAEEVGGFETKLLKEMAADMRYSHTELTKISRALTKGQDREEKNYKETRARAENFAKEQKAGAWTKDLGIIFDVALGKAIDKIWGLSGRTIGMIIGGIEVLGASFDSVKDALTKIGPMVWNAMPEFIKAIPELVGAYIDDLKEVFSNAWNWLEGNFPLVTKAVEKVADFVQDSVRGLADLSGLIYDYFYGNKQRDKESARSTMVAENVIRARGIESPVNKQIQATLSKAGVPVMEQARFYSWADTDPAAAAGAADTYAAAIARGKSPQDASQAATEYFQSAYQSAKPAAPAQPVTTADKTAQAQIVAAAEKPSRDMQALTEAMRAQSTARAAPPVKGEMSNGIKTMGGPTEIALAEGSLGLITGGLVGA